MFTGLVSAVGTVERIVSRSGNRLFTIVAPWTQRLPPGESVAVNGCCLTVVASEKEGVEEPGNQRFEVMAVRTTLATTTLGRLKVGSLVNLERALAAGDRLGGHLVQGHIDEVGVVRSLARRHGQWVLTIGVRRSNTSLLVPKGSVCVDGVSLTIASVRATDFVVNIIPFTWEHTTFSRLHAGAPVNIEYDIIVKAVQHQLQSAPAPRPRDQGFEEDEDVPWT